MTIKNFLLKIEMERETIVMMMTDTIITWKKGGTRVHVHDVAIVIIHHHNYDSFNLWSVVIITKYMQQWFCISDACPSDVTIIVMILF